LCFSKKRFENARLALGAIPVERHRDDQPLRRLEAERVHVRDVHEQRGDFLPHPGEAEFGRLLQRIGGVAAGGCKRDDLGAGGLRLQQEGGEIRSVERRTQRAEHLATVLPHDLGRLRFQEVTERVVGGYEEPGIELLFHQFGRGARGDTYVSHDHWKPTAEQFWLVNACVPDPEIRKILLASRVTGWIAMPTADEPPSTMASTCSASIQCRTMETPISGLF
jgi:hypothetical protein